jgi:geranylgeranyl diphosphate synthase type I
MFCQPRLDHSELRRGRPTLWVKWGIAQAINAGDLMFTLAQTAMLDMARTVPAPVALRMAEVLNTTCIKLTGGQYLDLAYEKQKEIPIESYWPMISGKTAALVEGCACLGALAAMVGEERIRAYSEFGLWLGQAFQVFDDYLGIWGEAELVGKSTDSDLVSGKKSLPVLFGIQNRGKFYQRWQQGAVRSEEVPGLAAMLVEEGAQAFTLKTADELTEKSLQALELAICSSNDACVALRELADQLLRRKK